jgi:hypothetical protein
MSVEATKLIIKGFVAENGIEEQFEEYLEEFREKLAEVKAAGDVEQTAYMLALSYLAAENQ